MGKYTIKDILRIVRKIRISHILYFVILLIAFRIVSGKITYNYQKKRLDKLSPKQIMNLSRKAGKKKDIELFEKIIHPTSDIKIDFNRKRSDLEKSSAGVEKAVRIIFGVRDKANYQKIFDANTAEVGNVMYSIFWPFAKARTGMMVLIKDNGIWKIHRDKWDWGNMLEHLRKNPNDISSYYLCSSDMSNKQDLLMKYRFRKKYYELDPDGFWVTKSFIEKLKADEEKYETNYKEYEKQLTAEMLTYSPNWKSPKARNYIQFARIYMFHQNYERAEIYMNKAEEVLENEKSSRRSMEEQFEDAWNELDGRINGTYIDPIEELDRLREAKK